MIFMIHPSFLSLFFCFRFIISENIADLYHYHSLLLRLLSFCNQLFDFGPRTFCCWFCYYYQYHQVIMECPEWQRRGEAAVIKIMEFASIAGKRWAFITTIKVYDEQAALGSPRRMTFWRGEACVVGIWSITLRTEVGGDGSTLWKF